MKIVAGPECTRQLDASRASEIVGWSSVLNSDFLKSCTFRLELSHSLVKDLVLHGLGTVGLSCLVEIVGTRTFAVTKGRI